MAEKLLKKTKDIEIKKKKRNNKSEEDNIYKIDLNVEQEVQSELQNEMEHIEHDDIIEVEETKKTKTKRAKSGKKKDNSIRKIDDDDDDVDELFGNANRWLKEESLDENVEEIEKKPKKKLTKIEEGIKSSKVTKTEKKSKSTDTATKKKTKEEIKETNKKTTKALATKTTKTTSRARTKSKSLVDDIYNLDNIKDLESSEEASYVKGEECENKENYSKMEKQSEIKMHAINDLTEISLKKNRYKIEIQKNEYNIYTDTNETSYIIVRDPGVRIVSGEVFIFLKKHDENYEITTNQDFKINYVIDNLERKNNTVNFKLTNLTEIVAYEDGLVFEIDEEKVIENNLEDNNTLVISEEDGKVYLPYTKEDIKNEVVQNRGIKISEVIEDKYILPLDKYKNSMKARFREGYNLMYKKEGKSRKSAIMLGIELMFETNLHPAIISACKNLEELDIYLDCLEDNELEKFSCFKIIYKSLPTLRKKTKFQEF